jgi:hypothetical protein
LKRIETKITINAQPEHVWDILMNFSEYPEWNPYIVSIRGLQEIGARLRVEMRIDHKKMSFKLKIVTLERAKAFEWLGALGFKGLFSGKHAFYLETTDNDKTVLTQAEEFRGWLVPFLWPKIKDGTTEGFEKMNEELKRRAEKLTSGA